VITEERKASAIHLVERPVEPNPGFPLRSRMRRVLQLPHRFRSCRAHASLRALRRFRRSLEPTPIPRPASMGTAGTMALFAAQSARHEMVN